MQWLDINGEWTKCFFGADGYFAFACLKKHHGQWLLGIRSPGVEVVWRPTGYMCQSDMPSRRIKQYASVATRKALIDIMQQGQEGC